MTILNISGKQGSGKSSMATLLADKLKGEGVMVVRRSFATPLYTLHDVVLNFLETLSGAPRPEKVGELLQVIGTEVGRKHFGQDVWVGIMEKFIQFHQREFPNCILIIDDCRFENEFDLLEKYNAIHVRLKASEEIRKERAKSWRENTQHPSEIGLDQYEVDGKFNFYLESVEQSFYTNLFTILNHLKDRGTI